VSGISHLMAENRHLRRSVEILPISYRLRELA
jgi:hypothetical protein